MSTTIKFTIADDLYSELQIRADKARLSIQDYIRLELFGSEDTFTPLDAINKALANYSSGERFTVPGIFGDSWNLPNGAAGQFGRKFFALVEKDYSDKIRFTNTFNARKHAIYEIV